MKFVFIFFLTVFPAFNSALHAQAMRGKLTCNSEPVNYSKSGNHSLLFKHAQHDFSPCGKISLSENHSNPAYSLMLYVMRIQRVKISTRTMSFCFNLDIAVTTWGIAERAVFFNQNKFSNPCLLH
ncbi:MAG TPA: hypothetical protein DCQ93_08580 [Bacteroidetes bacterium]|nr:hypothetical protein [Bacteroidota bacterium]